LYSIRLTISYKNIIESSDIFYPYLTLKIGNQVATCQLGLEKILYDAKCSTFHVGISINKWLLHEALEKGIHQIVEIYLTPEGRTLALQ
jgi:hypothetical protein